MHESCSLGACSLALLALCLPSFAIQVPAGTELQVRLKNKVSTETSKTGDAIEAVVIAPVLVQEQFVIPAGTSVRGSVSKAVHSGKADERSILALDFNTVEIGGKRLTLASQVIAVENARERVDADGKINGILASETLTGRLDSAIESLGGRYATAADILSIAKGAVLKAAESDISYDESVEMTLKLTAPLELKSAFGAGPGDKVKTLGNGAALSDLVSREPFQTIALNPPKPSDITNLLLVGTEDQIRKAFAAAGWKTAAELNAQAKFETLRALAEGRGYSEAPVSVLLLDGKPPDVVFEKMNNTFAQRHHLRIWRRPVTLQDAPVWAVAATHDIGISFSEQNRTFIHRIDPQIDQERSKVLNDLIFTGQVQAVSLVERPQVPKHGENATGDNLVTDGRIAVLALK